MLLQILILRRDSTHHTLDSSSSSIRLGRVSSALPSKLSGAPPAAAYLKPPQVVFTQIASVGASSAYKVCAVQARNPTYNREPPPPPTTPPHTHHVLTNDGSESGYPSAGSVYRCRPPRIDTPGYDAHPHPRPPGCAPQPCAFGERRRACLHCFITEEA